MNKLGISTFSFGLLCSVISISLLFLQAKHSNYVLLSLKKRFDSYLCFKYALKEVSKYNLQIININNLLKGLYPLTFSPSLKVQLMAKNLQKIAIITSDLCHLNLTRKILGYGSCNSFQKARLIQLQLYKLDTIAKHKRNIKKQAIKNRKGSFKFPINKGHLLARWSFQKGSLIWKTKEDSVTSNLYSLEIY